MTDKLPTNIWALKSKMDSPYTGTYCDTDDGGEQYTLVHNNPDYHVIPKSDVDGDVMGALDALVGNPNDELGKNLKSIIRNALIAQSDLDMVRVPRKVLDDALALGSLTIQKTFNPETYEIFDIHGGNTSTAHSIDEALEKYVLNYKPTAVGEERSDGEAE